MRVQLPSQLAQRVSAVGLVHCMCLQVVGILSIGLTVAIWRKPMAIKGALAPVLGNGAG